MIGHHRKKKVLKMISFLSHPLQTRFTSFDDRAYGVTQTIV